MMSKIVTHIRTKISVSRSYQKQPSKRPQSVLKNHPKNQKNFSRLSICPSKDSYNEVLKSRSDSTNTFIFTDSNQKAYVCMNLISCLETEKLKCSTFQVHYQENYYTARMFIWKEIKWIPFWYTSELMTC